jgi:hypothetical protein
VGVKERELKRKRKERRKRERERGCKQTNRAIDKMKERN